MLADFQIPTVSNDMKLVVLKNHLWDQILYRILDPKKRRQNYFNAISPSGFSPHNSL